MSHVYGVVPSRRLGRSLGVCTIPFKTCNYACVYCQLGRTTNMTNTRQTFYPPEEILSEARRFIEAHGEESFDVVTVVGEGEPTLYKPLDAIVRGLREMTGKPLVLITNGSLLFDRELVEEIKDFDIVMPTLDAKDEESFKRINRPFGKLTYEKVYKGLLDFSKEFKGEIWLEVMLIKDYNDSDGFLRELKKKIDQIKPARVYINVPARPPAESGIEVPSESAIEFARTLLNAESIENLPVSSFTTSEKEALDAVIEIIKRHPMSDKDIRSFVESQFKEESVTGLLKRLAENPNVEKKTYHGNNFYRYVLATRRSGG
ncbi:Fe-S oxidoreductase [Mesotoga prima MesG1.Ag.4.2]|uniref:Fe-S oxidoreductase n=1 Tax=Mesotoga prima MesG1.Ag.4.2 TaxID=660470 RepID=I2F847_9BACT|nr:Fe-S oxidoreductase [Mesotoga prima MesG1.Ag.4.2]